MLQFAVRGACGRRIKRLQQAALTLAVAALSPMSAIERITDSGRTSHHVRKVPQAEVKRHAISCTTQNDIVQSLLDEVSDYRHGAFRCIGDCRQ